MWGVGDRLGYGGHVWGGGSFKDRLKGVWKTFWNISSLLLQFFCWFTFWFGSVVEGKPF